MHAIVNLPGGRPYLSPVFGYYINKPVTAAEARFLTGYRSPFYIVWNPDGSGLMKCPLMVPEVKHMIPQILVVDGDCSDWNLNEEGEGCVSFLDKELIDSGELPEPVLRKCKSAYQDYVYPDTPEIKTEQDIANFMRATCGLHDACIAEEHLDADGTLHIHFEGIWGCEVDVWFWGDLEYDTSGRDPEKWDPYWFGATLLLHDDFIYLLDDDEAAVETIDSASCYFKARHMKYKIIPNKL